MNVLPDLRASDPWSKNTQSVSFPVLESATGKRSFSIAATALLLFAINFALHWPGELTPDSTWQYEQAISGHFNDWHPPIMAYTWSLLRYIADGPQPMLAFQLIFHWLGFAMLADGLSRTGRTKAGWLMLATGAFPLFFYFNGYITKDVGLVSASIAGFGLIFWYRIQGRRPPPAIVIAALVLIAYGALVRHNAVFAFAPLLLYAVVDPARIGARRLIILVCVLSIVAIPVSSIVNRHLFRATPSGAILSLQLIDVVGIARHSGDLSVLPSVLHLSTSDVEHCYRPYDTMDRLLEFGPCKFISERLVASTSAAERTTMWLVAIISHPVAYAQHRLKIFNSMMYFFVPAKHCRFSDSCMKLSPQEIRLDYIKRNILVWPASWIVLGVCMVAAGLGLSSASAPLSACRTLLVSGLGYSFAYLIVGVAADVRYHYWSIVAILTAFIVAFPLLVSRVRTMDRTVMVCFVLLTLTWGAGFFARLADIQVLMF